jgi:two-component system sensor histidine kinase BaeS
VVSGDPTRLRQLVVILLDNAVRHGPDGSLVRVTLRSDDQWAAIVVEDEGPGLRPADIPHLFERFWRAPDAPDGGTGLGLSIAAWIAERHGGRIEAANRESGGARFTVSLPGATALIPASDATMEPAGPLELS